jgi:hypothetical protein
LAEKTNSEQTLSSGYRVLKINEVFIAKNEPCDFKYHSIEKYYYNVRLHEKQQRLQEFSKHEEFVVQKILPLKFRSSIDGTKRWLAKVDQQNKAT